MSNTKVYHRCAWIENYPPSQLMTQYHDQEWGRPLHDDDKLFEILMMEVYQAGLSWSIVLNKRAAFNQQFKGYKIKEVAKLRNDAIESAMQNEKIIRNHAKLEATINNARAFIDIQKEFGSFDNYIWGFVSGKTINHKIKTMDQIPSQNELSVLISKDMKKRGFKFTGPIAVYTFLQAIGIINDHEVRCDFNPERIK